MNPDTSFILTAWALIATLLAIGLALRLLAMGQPRRGSFSDSAAELGAPTRQLDQLDPWEMQRMLMQASGQRVPLRLEINEGSLLYCALILEETAEQFEAVLNVIRQHPLGSNADVASLMSYMQGIKHGMGASSRTIRKQLQRIVPFSIHMNLAQAAEVADGTTDLAVVNCGFAVSCGIPGRECYEEVGISNLSKRNPDTFKIDKHPDGKWIKGSDYVEPNLEQVLLQAS